MPGTVASLAWANHSTSYIQIYTFLYNMQIFLNPFHGHVCTHVFGTGGTIGFGLGSSSGPACCFASLAFLFYILLGPDGQLFFIFKVTNSNQSEKWLVGMLSRRGAYLCVCVGGCGCCSGRATQCSSTTYDGGRAHGGLFVFKMWNDEIL
jgi:hypothetical protein